MPSSKCKTDAEQTALLIQTGVFSKIPAEEDVGSVSRRMLVVGVVVEWKV